VIDNIDIKECIIDKYYRIYSTKSFFLQTYMDDFILRGGLGFAREVLYRANDFYSDNKEKKVLSLSDIVEHLNRKFTDKELEIICEERKKCFNENIKIWDVINNFNNKS